MSENEMGYRGSKSEITELSTVKTISVKEQRVDGSCSGSVSTPRLRCTLLGGESRYPVKIPSNQINNIKYYSSNSDFVPTKGMMPSTFAVTPLDP